MRLWIERGLLATGGTCLGLWALVTFDAHLHATREGARLAGRARELEAAPDQAAAEVRRAAPGAVWGRLEVPRVGVSALIAAGIDEATLRRAVGHVPGTAFPGDAGNVGLAGHRDGVFRGLRDVREGDLVRIHSLEGDFDYRVESTEVVASTRTDVLGPTSGPVVTLVTCHPFNYVGPAPDRFIVRARQVAPGAGTAGRLADDRRLLGVVE